MQSAFQVCGNPTGAASAGALQLWPAHCKQASQHPKPAPRKLACCTGSSKGPLMPSRLYRWHSANSAWQGGEQEQECAAVMGAAALQGSGLQTAASSFGINRPLLQQRGAASQARTQVQHALFLQAAEHPPGTSLFLTSISQTLIDRSTHIFKLTTASQQLSTAHLVPACPPPTSLNSCCTPRGRRPSPAPATAGLPAAGCRHAGT